MAEQVNKIFALFSVDNNYDQPSNNLVCWWSKKPTLEVLAAALGMKFPAPVDEKTLAIVKIWSMESQRIDNADYRLQIINEGRHL